MPNSTRYPIKETARFTGGTVYYRSQRVWNVYYGSPERGVAKLQVIAPVGSTARDIRTYAARNLLEDWFRVLYVEPAPSLFE